MGAQGPITPAWSCLMALGAVRRHSPSPATGSQEWFVHHPVEMPNLGPLGVFGCGSITPWC